MIFQRNFATLFLLIVSVYVHAQGVFGGGDGTQSNPYLISDASHFKELSDSVLKLHDYSGVYFIVTNDIDFNNEEHYSIGGSTVLGCVPFSGYFDGQNFEISNCIIKYPPQAAGLFGEISSSAEIKNIHFVSGSVSGSFNVGGIVGYNSGSISGCVTGPSLSIIANEWCAGGIAGYNNLGAEIVRCVNHATVSGNVGGIYNAYRIGGICGCSMELITECYNTGTIYGKYEVGGIVGLIDANSDVKNCYNTGVVSAVDYQAGGIAGAFMESFYNHITNCYNYGPVSSQTKTAAICYFVTSNSIITNCHYDDVTSLTSDAHASAQSTSTMTGGSFSPVLNSTTATCWAEDIVLQNNGYPVFGWNINVGNEYEPEIGNKPLVLSSEGNIIIQFEKPTDGIVSLFTVSGQLIKTESVSSSSHIMTAENDNLYLILIITDKGQFIQKIFH